MYYSGFFFKKLISAFLMPLPFSLAIIFIGLAFLWLTKKQKTGKVFVTIGACLLFVMSLGIISDIVVSPIMESFQIYKPNKNKPVKFVVVLSGGASSKDGVPLNTSSDYITLSRLMEGIRVYKCNPGSKIILTGRSFFPEKVPFSVVESYLLINLGIPREDIILDIESLDTSEEVLNVKKIINETSFVLVTSASHMPRAIKLFRKQNMNPIPAPTNFYVRLTYLSFFDFIPNTASIYSIDAVVHEYFGILWAKIRGEI